MNKREEQLLGTVGLRYHAAVEVSTKHLMDVIEAIDEGILEVHEGTLYLSAEWRDRLNDIDVGRVSLAVAAELEERM